MKRQWCTRHWAPIRDDRGVNGVHAAYLLMEAIGADITAKLASPHPTVEDLTLAVIKRSPLCCYLGDEQMAQIIDAARQHPAPPIGPRADFERATLRRIGIVPVFGAIRLKN